MQRKDFQEIEILITPYVRTSRKELERNPLIPETNNGSARAQRGKGA